MDEFQKRKALRLKEYDYSSVGCYFITVCTYKRARVLSNIVGAIHESPKIQLTEQGKIVDNILSNLPMHLGVEIGTYAIMPDHIHLVIAVTEDKKRAIRESPLQARSIISKVVGFIKMNASKAIHQQYGDVPVWQRGYYDHIIRNYADYQETVRYISENPIRWILNNKNK